jgi:hypothetical protein
LGSTKEQRDNRRHLSGLAHRTIRCATGHVRCTRGLQLKLVTFGKFQRKLHYNSPDCTVYTGHVRCSKEERPPELASLGNSFQLLRYNSPDMSSVHRTVRCNSGATATSGANGYLQRIYCAPACAEARHAHAGAPDTLQYMSGAPPDIQAGPEDRAPTVRTQRLW